jgi:hypothetical protein
VTRPPATASPRTATQAPPRTAPVCPGAHGRLTALTAHLDRERRQQAAEQTERRRIEAAVQLLDEAIEACETEHLDGEKEATPELVRQARAAVTAATTATCRVADPAPIISQDARLSRTGLLITDVMDVVWEVVDILLDLLVPGRSATSDALGPDTPLSAAPAPSRRLDGAAPARQGCAYCGRRCERQDPAGIGFCSPDHLLRARRLHCTRTTAVADVGAFFTPLGA